MAQNTDTFVTAFRAKMFKLLLGEEPAAGSYLSFLPVGIAVPEQVLLDYQNDVPDAVHQLSVLLNDLPTASGDYKASGAMLWNEYQLWLNQYEPPTANFTDEDKEALEKAVAEATKLLPAYMKYAGLYRAAVNVRENLQFVPKAERPKDWQQKYLEAEDAVLAAAEEWKILGSRQTYETAAGNMIYFGRKDPGFLRNFYFSNFESNGRKFGKESYWPTSLAPSLITGGQVPWGKFIMTEQEIEKYENTRNVHFGGEASIDASGFGLELSAEGEYVNALYKLSTKGIKVEFELMRVLINRPWFDTSLLFSKGWRWPGQTVDHPDIGVLLSDGEMPPRAGKLKLIPTEAIFVRKLKVKIDWKDEVNKEYRLAIEGRGSLGFSFLKISGTVKWEDKEYSVESKTSEEGFELDTPQIAAFLCTVPPVCPDPDWQLWRKDAAIQQGFRFGSHRLNRAATSTPEPA